jgi:C-terminal processing protease CtpA/Prc
MMRYFLWLVSMTVIGLLFASVLPISWGAQIKGGPLILQEDEDEEDDEDEEEDEDDEDTGGGAWIGIDPDPDYEGKGVKIKKVKKRSPAKKAGLKKGDIILKFGDKKVEDMDEFYEVLFEHKPGDKVKLTIKRKGKKKVVKVKLVEIPEEEMREWRRW